MFPLRDDNPTLHLSFATYLILGINVAAWVFIQGMGMQPALIQSVWTWGLIPGELLGFVDDGQRVQLGPGVVAVLDGVPNPATLITSMFMHGGWMHLIGNMWFLYVFGDNVEDVMGSVRFVIFYLLCGLAAAIAQIVLGGATSVIPMVGASGAIGGVMGAYMMFFPSARVHLLVFLGFFITRIAVPAVLMLGYWFFLQFLSGSTSGASGGGVAFWAHVGGFVAGFLMARPFSSRKRLQERRVLLGSRRWR